MRRERISYLLHQFMNDVLTPAERGELFAILQEHPDHVQKVIAGMLEQQTPSSSFDEIYWQGVLEKILSSDKQPTQQEIPVKAEQASRTKVKIYALFRWAAAAVFLLLVSVGAYLWLNRQGTSSKTQAVRSQDHISPGSNKAVLTLADGSAILLDESEVGELAREGNTTISKLDDGQLAYLADQTAPPQEAVSAFNTISTPRGGQYQLVLSDGTRVWLNAGSSLRYPASFTGKERKVKLRGEAYFEVARQDGNVPFIVSVNNMEVAVLGTKFNVMAYEDEALIKTTLLEGKVMVSLRDPQKSGTPHQRFLEPGQQAQVRTIPGTSMTGGKISVIRKQDPEREIAWKKGYFIFSGDPIQDIMRKIARWYDVEVAYRGNITPEGFSGTMSRFENVSEVLDMLELTGLVHFKLEGRRITVMPSQDLTK